MLALCLLLPLAQEILAPKSATWEDLRTAFPASWEFPQVDAREQNLPSARFEKRLLELVRTPLLGSEDENDAFYLGDLITICRSFSWRSEYVQTILDSIAPQISRMDFRLLEDLFLCDGLTSKNWGPSKERHDGMAFGPTWDLPKTFWLNHKGSRSVEQAATLIMADISAIKKAEHAFTNYLSYAENSYLKVAPAVGSYLRVQEADSEDCAAACLEVNFKADLPFPFTTYKMNLSILHRTRPTEDLVSFVFGRGDDIHWMAGYDRYWTIRNRVGDAVATLLVRQLAFDLSEVPERSSDRQEGLRSGIGNLRRSAEKLFDQSWSESKDGTGTVPFFPVLCPE
ncbi:MAG: hypothetical protein COA70_07890 [Planctomycetota bacterium]|nr:MAG: hypothetical protein COA70_07890 [Planctomycetota bacterium]